MDVAETIRSIPIFSGLSREDIAKVLGKTYRAKQRSETGKSYAHSKEKFLEMGACNACADNIAQYYTKKPDSPCAIPRLRKHWGMASKANCHTTRIKARHWVRVHRYC